MTWTRGGSGTQSTKQERVLSTCSQSCCLSRSVETVVHTEEMVEGRERLGFVNRILTPCTLHTMHQWREIVRFDGSGQPSHSGLSSFKKSSPFALS
jgi:hypothetical protein